MGIALFIFIYLKYIMFPVFDSINKNKADIDNYNSQLNVLKVSGITNNRLKTQLAETKIKYNEALLNLPLLEKNPEIAYNLKPIADANSVALDNLSLSDGVLYTPSANTQNKKGKLPIDNSNLYSINANLNVTTTDYSNIMDFLSAIENDKRINEVTNFSIQYQRLTKVAGTTSNNQTPADASTTPQAVDTTQQNTDSSGQAVASTDQTNTTSAQTTTVNVEPVSASISVNYFYNLSSDQKPKYDFNKGTYGKDDLFK